MLTVYLSAPPLREPVASKCASFTLRVFNSGNLASKLGESCTHCFFCWRYSVRGFGFFVYMVKGLGSIISGIVPFRQKESLLAQPDCVERLALRGLPLLPANIPECAVTDQPLLLFIPQAVSEGFEAGEQSDGFDALKERFRFMTFLEVIIGNARTQMMDVMKANIAREPLQHFGQLIK